MADDSTFLVDPHGGQVQVSRFVGKNGPAVQFAYYAYDERSYLAVYEDVLLALLVPRVRELEASRLALAAQTADLHKGVCASHENVVAQLRRLLAENQELKAQVLRLENEALRSTRAITIDGVVGEG